MKKANVFTLECDEDMRPRENTELILFHSVAPSYAFVDDLNKLYSLSLHRLDDMRPDSSDLQWPLFAHYDPHSHLHYYLAERPVGSTGAPFWTAGHKLLIILGERALLMADTIEADFNSSPDSIAPTDIIALMHCEMLDRLRNDFTTITRLAPSSDPPPSLKGKALREYNELQNLVDCVLDYIDLKYISDN